MKQKLVILGSGGHGRVVLDIARKNGYQDIVFLDDHPKTDAVDGAPIVGSCADAILYADADFFVAIGDNWVREKLQCELSKKGLQVVSLIHPQAILADAVSLGAGVVVMAGAVINPGAVLGDGVIVNTSASVDHDCVIGEYVHIAAGAHLCGAVTVGTRAWIGAGVTVRNHIRICSECVIGLGGVVVQDIENKGTYIGIPVRKQ